MDARAALQTGMEHAAHLEELEDAELDLLVLVLLLLGLGVCLLFALLGSSHEARQDVQRILISHARLRQHTAVLQLPSSK